DRILAPSAIKSPINTHVPREMTTAEIESTLSDFVRAAELAREAGYDGVELMGSEGYLVTQFLALRTNQRRDEWGGALENRMRFATELVRRTRPAFGIGWAPNPEFRHRLARSAHPNDRAGRAARRIRLGHAAPPRSGGH